MLAGNSRISPRAAVLDRAVLDRVAELEAGGRRAEGAASSDRGDADETRAWDDRASLWRANLLRGAVAGRWAGERPAARVDTTCEVDAPARGRAPL